MADKPISGLTPVDRVKPADLFVLEQDGQARSVSGQTWVNWLVAYADGHGGVQSVAKTGTSGLVDTYTITLADGSTQAFTVTNGAKGEKGDQTYVYVRWSAVPNPSDNDLSDKPEAYIGICATTSETAPTTASAYAPWYRYKGEPGNTGAPATLVSKSIQYMAADSGDVIPSGSWLDRIPVVEKGRYLWTRTTLIFNTGDPVVSYSVGRMGLDGDGSVNSVNGLTGDVELRANNIKLQDSDFSVQTELGQHQAALDGKAPIVNKKLLDNWYFLKPVNQRGQTSYSGNHIYSLDRWIINEITLYNNGDVSVGVAVDPIVYQIIDKEKLPEHPCKVTASAIVNGNLLVTTTNWTGSELEESAGGDSIICIECGMVIGKPYFKIGMRQDCKITAVGFEEGDTQTLAHQENGVWVLNEIPDPDIELMKCQKHYLRTSGAVFSGAAWGDIGWAGFNVPTCVRMNDGIVCRIITQGSVMANNGVVYAHSPNNPNVDNISASGVRIGIYVGNGIPSGTVCLLDTALEFFDNLGG